MVAASPEPTLLGGRVRRLTTVGLASLALAWLAVLLAVYFQRGFVPGDAHNYLAAGERLNAGHPLYELHVEWGDRFVALKPPHWTVPLLSPPLVAVVWRPLAALPEMAGVAVWWALTIGAMALTVLLLLRRAPVPTAFALLLLGVPVVYEIGVGNVNALLLLGAVAVWRLAVGRHDGTAGILLALLIGLKLTPVVLVAWVIGQRRWRMLGATLAGGLLWLAVGIAGAGLDAHLRFLEIARGTSGSSASELSLTGLALSVGVDAALAAALPTVSLVLGAVLVGALPRRPGLAWAIACVAWVAGSPVVNINTPALLLASLAPLAWPRAAGWRPATGESPEFASRRVTAVDG